MKVDYLFSRNKKSLVSRLISWAAKCEKLSLDQNPSHMAILIDSTMVIESTLTTGVRIIPYTHWLKKNEELYKIPCRKTNRRSQEVLEKAFSLWGKNYDWVGICYFAWRYLGLIVLGRPMSAKNHWQNKNRYFCCEYAATLAGEDFSMKSPAKVCHYWLEAMK